MFPEVYIVLIGGNVERWGPKGEVLSCIKPPPHTKTFHLVDTLTISME